MTRRGGAFKAALGHVREVVVPLGEDRYLHPDLATARECVALGRLVPTVESAVGPLMP